MIAQHKMGTGSQIFFGNRNGVLEAERLVQMGRLGVPIDVGPGGNLEHEISYKHHPSAEKNADEVMAEARADVARGRAIAFHLE